MKAAKLTEKQRLRDAVERLTAENARLVEERDALVRLLDQALPGHDDGTGDDEGPWRYLEQQHETQSVTIEAANFDEEDGR